MKTIERKAAPTPPSLTKALMAGFDAISNHISLILFPVVLDLILWLAPHFQLRRLVETLFSQVGALPEMQSAEMVEMVQNSQEIWLVLTERFNLISVLRTYPIGIPSLMVSRSPILAPGGEPAVWEVPSILAAIGLWVGLSLIGLIAGTLYFGLVADAATSGNVDWVKSLRQWPRKSLQVISLALFWFFLLLAISIPFSCFLSLFIISGFNLGQFTILLFGGILVWMLLPLVFSPHGIFVHGLKMWNSVIEGVRLARMTITRTGMFFILVLVLSEGMDVLWRIPPEDSWLAVIGVAGHAFITTGLLAASFVYYKEAGRWSEKVIQQARLSAL